MDCFDEAQSCSWDLGLLAETFEQSTVACRFITFSDAEARTLSPNETDFDFFAHAPYEMASQDDDDLRLIRASNSLLEDLERSLPRLLWKSKTNRVHQLVRLRDLDYVLQLVRYIYHLCRPSIWLLTLTRLSLFSQNLSFSILG